MTSSSSFPTSLDTFNVAIDGAKTLEDGSQKHSDIHSWIGDALNKIEVAVSGIASAEGTSDVRVTSTTGQEILSLGAITYAAVPVLVEFSCCYINYQPDGSGGCGVFFELRDGGTLVCTMGVFGSHNSNASRFAPIYVSHAFTPSAGAHTYQLYAKKWAAGEDDYLIAGDGLGGNKRPMRLSSRYV